MDVEDKLALDAIKPDNESHIVIEHTVCRRECRRRFCLYVCPAKLYEYDPERDEIQIEFAGCLECGTCRVGCVYGALTWGYPRGAHGVQYRYG